MKKERQMRTIWNDLLNLFFPNLCKICERPLINGEEQICLHCLCDLPRTGYHKRPDINPVEERFLGKFPIERASAFLKYEKKGKTQTLIHLLKYYDNKELGYLLGRQMARELLASQSPLCEVDLLLPVPLHPRKKRERGYNQSEWIALGLQSIWGIPLDCDTLVRTVHTGTQTRKATYERWTNVYSIFKVEKPDRLSDKHVLLIDDVITTGATLTACAEALSGIQGIRISILVLSSV